MSQLIQGFVLGATIATLACIAIYLEGSPQSAAGRASCSGDLRKLRLSTLFGARLDQSPPGMGPLIVTAAMNGQTDVVRYLHAEGIDVETKDKFNGTALSRAAQMVHRPTVELLLELGARPNVEDLEGGNTPIDLLRMNAGRVEELLAAKGGKAKTTGK